MTRTRAAGVVLALGALLVVLALLSGPLYTLIPGNAPHALSTALP